MACLAAAVLPADAAAFATHAGINGKRFSIGSSPDGNYLAGLVAGANHDTIAAATFFRRVLRSDPHNLQLLERTFVVALANGNMNEAFHLADRILSQAPKNGLAHLTKAVQAFKARQFSTARRELRQATSGRHPDITAALLTAWAYAGAKNEKRALATINDIHDPRFEVFRNYHAGLIAALFGDVGTANRRLKAAYNSEKTTLRIVDAYARFLDRHHDAAGAKKAYHDFNAVLPHHPIVKAALAKLDAGRRLQPLVSNAEAGAAEVLYGLGAVGSASSDDLASIIYLRFAIYLAPRNALAIVTLADDYERQKQGEEAIKIYETVPEKSPLRLNANIQAALILDTLGHRTEATKRLQNLVAARPGNVDALLALGNLERSHKHFEQAIAAYTKVLAHTSANDASSWTTYYFRGICEQQSNHWPAAEADFKKALKLSPDQPLVLNYLGYSWVDQGTHLDEAFKMLRRAVELRPTDGYIVDSLGWAYYKLGHYHEAVHELEKAIALKPGDPVINDHLGDAYWKTGRKLEAHFQWNHARDSNPDPKDLPRILAKIAHGMVPSPIKPAAEAQPSKSGG